MKKLEELGISPAPWDYQMNHPDGGLVSDAMNWRLTAFNIKPSDARLISAAPEL